MAPGSAAGAPFTRSMLRWFAALADADRSPATLVALGDSLVFHGSLHSAVDRLASHYNPTRFDNVTTGYGWTNGATFTGDGVAADVGGFDGEPRLLRDGERCRTTRMGTTGATLYGTGRFAVSVNGRDVGQAEVSVSAPHTVDPEAFTPGLTTLEVEARGDASLHGAHLSVGNDDRGIRYFQIGNLGKTFRWYLDHTDAMAHLAAVDPDLVILEMAINDLQQLGVDGFARGFEEFASTMRATLPTVASCYWFPQPFAGVSRADHAAAKVAASGTCARHDLVFIDGEAVLGSTADGDDTEGITIDGVHFSDMGKLVFADAVLATIAPGLQLGPHVLTSAQMRPGQIHAGAASGGAELVRPPSTRFNVLHGTAPNAFTSSGLFFSEAVHLSATEPPDPPPAGSLAVFARSTPAGGIELCVRFPDGSVQVLASQG